MTSIINLSPHPPTPPPNVKHVLPKSVPNFCNFTYSLQRKDVLAAFNHFDSDGSGSIDMSELGVAMKSLGFEPRKEDLKAMLGSMDDDENGTINFEEFLNMMTIKISESAAKKECEKAFKVALEKRFPV